MTTWSARSPTSSGSAWPLPCATASPPAGSWWIPGIGFGKGLDHNLTLLRRLRALAALGRPVLVGLSRKSFLGRLAGSGPQAGAPSDRGRDPRLAGSLAGAAAAVLAGAHMVRVHDVPETCRAVGVADAIRGARAPDAP